MCNCPQPWDGPDCTVFARAKFLGTWVATENYDGDSCSTVGPGNITFEAKITKSQNDIHDIFIENFGGYGESLKLKCHINADNLKITSQGFTGITFSGTGMYNDEDSTFVITYTAIDGCDKLVSTATYKVK
ncbi:MAG: hypothetical protein IIA45_08620 [Bacteroidetes bacterium]|nr:hypothetical protein [Bacteroidota bacterium]